jgi:hypothetical protein
MNHAAVENENLRMLSKTADRPARALCDGARAGRSKKQMLTIVAGQLGSVPARCPRCKAEWPVMLLGAEEARHICVVARRGSFLSLRRRLEEQFAKARLACPSCMANGGNGEVQDGPDAAETGGSEAAVAAAGSDGAGPASCVAGT